MNMLETLQRTIEIKKNNIILMSLFDISKGTIFQRYIISQLVMIYITYLNSKIFLAM